MPLTQLAHDLRDASIGLQASAVLRPNVTGARAAAGGTGVPIARRHGGAARWLDLALNTILILNLKYFDP